MAKRFNFVATILVAVAKRCIVPTPTLIAVAKRCVLVATIQIGVAKRCVFVATMLVSVAKIKGPHGGDPAQDGDDPGPGDAVLRKCGNVSASGGANRAQPVHPPGACEKLVPLRGEDPARRPGDPPRRGLPLPPRRPRSVRARLDPRSRSGTSLAGPRALTELLGAEPLHRGRERCTLDRICGRLERWIRRVRSPKRSLRKLDGGVTDKASRPLF